MVSISFDFSPDEFEREIIRELEQQVRRELTFPGASSLRVKIIKDSSGELQLSVVGEDALVEEARKRLGL